MSLVERNVFDTASRFKFRIRLAVAGTAVGALAGAAVGAVAGTAVAGGVATYMCHPRRICRFLSNGGEAGKPYSRPTTVQIAWKAFIYYSDDRI